VEDFVLPGIIIIYTFICTLGHLWKREKGKEGIYTYTYVHTFVNKANDLVNDYIVYPIGNNLAFVKIIFAISKI
jgi:hypothetical protein